MFGGNKKRKNSASGVTQGAVFSPTLFEPPPVLLLDTVLLSLSDDLSAPARSHEVQHASKK